MPPLDRTVLHDHLAACRFSELFTQDMGWDWPAGANAHPFPITIDGRAFEFRTVAHKRGVGVLHCKPRDPGPLPSPSLRGRLEREVAKKIHEHIIIFTDAANTVQVWQTALRRAGFPIRRSEYTLHLAAGATGEPLAQRLDRLAFTLDEEELLTLPDVLARMQESGLHAERITKRFYQEFASQKKVFTEFIEGLASAGDRSWYASVMLNRLMFVWFIQAKSFLDQNPNYLPDKLEQVTGVGSWFTITPRAPQFFRDGKDSSSTRENALSLESDAARARGLCVLNSSLFYWFYQVRTNCRDFNPSDFKLFPVPPSLADEAMDKLALELTRQLDASAEFVTASHSITGEIRYEQFRPRSAKPIPDEIDRVLARHYGFTDEELDFIINYDLKYRLGRDSGDEAED
jgi:hypothetical protein